MKWFDEISFAKGWHDTNFGEATGSSQLMLETSDRVSWMSPHLPIQQMFQSVKRYSLNCAVSAILRSVLWHFLTDIFGQPIGSALNSWPIKIGPISFPETSVSNCKCFWNTLLQNSYNAGYFMELCKEIPYKATRTRKIKLYDTRLYTRR